MQNILFGLSEEVTTEFRTLCLQNRSHVVQCKTKNIRPDFSDRTILAPPVGLEPTTTRLTAECSCTWHIVYPKRALEGLGIYSIVFYRSELFLPEW